jgi:RHS repeat-associated protein
LTSRSDYDAFGLQTGGSSANSIGYTGQRLDSETGLMALGNGERYYSPSYARFIQQDSFSGNGSMPQSLNRFAYGLNNPNKFTDPSGHKVVDPFAKPVAKKAKNAKSEENNTDRSSYKFWDDASKSDSYLESGAGYTGKFFYGFGDLLTSGGVSRQDRILTAYQRGEISGTEALWRTGGNIAVSAPLLVAGILTGGSSIYVQVGITMIAAGVQRFGTDSYEIAYEGREGYSSAGEYATDIALAGAFTVGGHLLTKYGGKALKYAEGKLAKLEEAAGSVRNFGKKLPTTQELITISTNAKGNPRAIYKGLGELNEIQTSVLSKLKEFGSNTTISKKIFNQRDLSALTAATGDEFAMFTAGGRRMIMRGSLEGVPVTPEIGKVLASKGWRWSAHTHPGGEEVLRSSGADRIVLESMGGKSSAILNSEGRRKLFSTTEDLLTGWLP